jgi:transposase
MITARLMRFSSSRTFPGQSIKGKPRLCKIGHARLRKALYMPALVSIQCNPVMIAFYNRLKDKGKMAKLLSVRLCENWFTLSLAF